MNVFSGILGTIGKAIIQAALGAVLAVASSTARELMREHICAWYAACKKTDNPNDDHLCEAVMTLLKIECP